MATQEQVRPAAGSGPDLAVRGRDQFMLSLLLALGCLAGCALLQLFLYARPAPHGGAFLLEWKRYFALSLYYELLGVWLLAFPFFLLWLALYRRRLRSRWWRLIGAVQAALMTLNLLLSAADHEILRFLGVRLNASFVLAYGQPRLLADGLFLDLVRADRGGAYLPIILVIAVPSLYLWWASRLLRERSRRAPPLWFAILLALVPLAAPANGWRMATGQFRLRKVEPVLLAFATDMVAGFEDLQPPSDMDRLIGEYQRAWLARSADPKWRFPDSSRPYLRAPAQPAPNASAEPRWNVIYLQLETLRGVDTGFLRPDLPRSPTPYLDRLARGPDAAVWTRALSFGMPSINGIFATHCSIMPPSRRYITSLTDVRFLCLPELLRSRGYRAEMFHGDDTDWDNSTVWFRSWYDKLWRYPRAGRRDRDVFRRAAERIRQLGRSGKPFFAAVVSVSNHTPFTSQERATDIAGYATPAERILNTTHYTDDVVRELIESLRPEPWFKRTLIVVIGDHGFNVGEHKQVPGQQNLYRESVWVPFIIAGAHPRLATGVHDDIVTQLDLAPTLADLLGHETANPWQGHSLLAVKPGGGVAFGFRQSLLTETATWTALRDPSDGQARLYRAREDWLQRRNLALQHPALTRRLLDRADRARRLNDFLLRHDRLWRPPPPGSRSAS